jgi:hypothetical protein
MPRKKWTPKTEADDAVLKFRDKRRWQIALRRYVVYKHPSANYAPFFGVDIQTFRQWIELQFTPSMTWENFGHLWQFDHILPVIYFDFNDVEQMKLCWSFVNIRCESIEANKNKGAAVDFLNVKAHFEGLLAATSFPIIGQLIAKLNEIEQSQHSNTDHLAGFINQNKTRLLHFGDFDAVDFLRINQGLPAEDLLAEKELFRRFAQ